MNCSAERPHVFNNSSRKISGHGSDKMPSLLKANDLILYVEVKRHLRVLLVLFRHSRTLSSLHTYNPQNSCSESEEEFIWT